MWGFGSSKKKSPAHSRPGSVGGSLAGSSASLGLDLSPGADLDLDLPEPSFTDDDLNDPSLLAELAALSGPAPAPKARVAQPAAARPATAAARAPAPVAAKAAAAEPDVLAAELHVPERFDEDVHVEFTDQDMNDPHLLAELGRIGGHEHADSAAHPDHEQPKLDRAGERADGAAGDLEELAGAMAGMSLHSRQAHRADAQQPASPQTDAAPDAVQAPASDSDDLPLELRLKTRDAALLAKYIQLERIKAVNKRQAGDRAGALESLAAVKQMQARADEMAAAALPAVGLADLQRRQIEFKKAAVAANRADNKARAREMLISSKKLQEVIDVVAIAPSATLVRSVTVTGNVGDVYKHLLDTLAGQAELCTTVAAQYFRAGQKDMALEFHKRKKRMLSDIDTLKLLRSASASSQSGTLPFTFKHESLAFTISQTNQDVGLEEMEIAIVRAMDLSHREVQPSEIESCVAFDAGWPQVGEATGPEGKGETPMVRRTPSPEYGFTKRVRIERNRAFQRFLERRKAVFEIYHSKPGLLSYVVTRRLLLGKATIKLEPLLTKCEIHEIVDIVDPNNPRKPTGSKLEIKIRLRQPLLKQDMKPKLQQARPQPPQQPAPNPAPDTSAVDIEALELDFLNPDRIASNQVLESEHSQILGQIAQLQAAKKPVPDDLSDRRTAYEIRMNMLVTLVQLGKLSMEDYIGQVKASIAETKKAALDFKRAGRIDLAKQALMRMKLMTAEVEEVEQAQ
nr:Coiled-coil and C2 domain-containing protein 1B [Polyrhizophydium stewartii]